MKELKKMSFAGVQSLLSKEEMKQIMAGSGGSGSGSCSSGCNSADDCPAGQHCYGGNNKPDCTGKCTSN